MDQIQNNRGFTLLEMIVSVGIFSVAIFIIMTILFSMVAAQKKAIDIQNAQDNVRFAFEAMVKEIRTGRNYYCAISVSDVALTGTKNCSVPNVGKSFTFTNSGDRRVTYQVDATNQLVKSKNGTPPCDGNPANDPDDCLVITSSAVMEVQTLDFYVRGAAGNDDQQAFATVVLKGQVINPKGGAPTEINLQASISRRGFTDQP